MGRRTATGRSGVAIALGTTIAMALVACAGDTRAADSDRVMADELTPDRPGCSAAAAIDGQVVWASAMGVSDEAGDRVIDTSTRFNIGSVSKQFTATAVLILVEEDTLALDDEITAFFPALPDWAASVTIDDLMHHTSGIIDPVFPESEIVTRDAVLERLETGARVHQDGGAYLYANANYVLLADIVAQVTGQTFSDWMTAHVFEPVGADIGVLPQARGDDIAVGYGDETDLWTPWPDTWAAVGSSSIVATPSELAEWGDHYREPALITSATLEDALAAGVRVYGGQGRYAAGIFVDGRGILQHSGIDAGISTAFATDPARGVTLAGSCNGAAEDDAAWAALWEIWFPDR